jgi:Gamma-glutamyl cyclotransferase, AIG2-like
MIRTATADERIVVLLRHTATTRSAIVGYDLDYVTITDPHVVATSGSDRHPILRPTDRPDAHVDGFVFTISETELAAADEYEVDAYQRISVPLRSGPRAWVYVFAG